jgi:hypothetical protein
MRATIAPYHYNYKSISVKERDYLVLCKKKQTIESAIGRTLTWSDFLLVIAGLKSIAEEERIARLANGQSPSETVGGTSQLEEIVARHVDIAISAMKKRR